ncbi:hypothetical protein ACIP5N_32035 [Streptomyces sp. NPDC088768]|uniref:glycine-rich domain-containing protein n=1 Tax=Streptomyces sp. NPDC088768 TaxID=3365894 RepID=UPI00382BE63B
MCACGEYFTVSRDGELCLIPGMQGLRATLHYKTPGNHQFRPGDYPWLARVRVRVQAGGGGSAGADADASQTIARPGGAGGGYSEALIALADLGTTESVVVGAGGTAGGANASGGPGGTSSFGGFVVANGGDGGTANMDSGVAITTSSGVAGPLAGTGEVNMGGGASGVALRLSGTNGYAGFGGDSFMGTGGLGRSTAGPGTSTRGYGAGAGGALSLNGSAEAGGTGGNGIVIVELYG